MTNIISSDKVYNDIGSTSFGVGEVKNFINTKFILK